MYMYTRENNDQIIKKKILNKRTTTKGTRMFSCYRMSRWYIRQLQRCALLITNDVAAQWQDRLHSGPLPSYNLLKLLFTIFCSTDGPAHHRALFSETVLPSACATEQFPSCRAFIW
jgi:hypothetical protein